MFKPTKEKSVKSAALIQKIFSLSNPSQEYTLVYAYDIKRSLFGMKKSFYIIGFNERTYSMLILTINAKGDILKKARITKSDISAVRQRMQTQLSLKTSRGSYTFFVPPYTPQTLESYGVLPILQEKESAAFHNFIKMMK